MEAFTRSQIFSGVIKLRPQNQKIVKTASTASDLLFSLITFPPFDSLPPKHCGLTVTRATLDTPARNIYDLKHPDITFLSHLKSRYPVPSWLHSRTTQWSLYYCHVGVSLCCGTRLMVDKALCQPFKKCLCVPACIRVCMIMKVKVRYLSRRYL